MTAWEGHAPHGVRRCLAVSTYPPSPQDGQDRLSLDEYDTLKFRVFGDGRKYLASIRTENWIIGDATSADVFQAFLFARCGGLGCGRHVLWHLMPCITAQSSIPEPGPKHCCRKNEWSEVEIPMSRFLLTHKGRLVETHVEMNRARIVSFGLALATGDAEPEGPYSLGLDWIAAVDSRRLDVEE